MAYGNSAKVRVNAGGMTQKQVDLILRLANKKAWDLHPKQNWREWFAMHIGDLESNPASSPLTGGWNGTASAFINELQKLPERANATVEIGSTPDDSSDPWAGPVYEENDNGTQGPRILGESENREAKKELVGPGVYNYEGMMYAVKESRTNPGKHYAYSIRLVNNKFKHEYAKGIIFKLTEEMRVSAKTVVALNVSTIHEHNGRRVGSCCVCGRMLTKKSSIDAGIGPVCGGRVGL